ncbi:MAG: hypothetical protein QOD63_1523, partial [Actinomycetota bacterium]|nr:hypothetical protein [Actinomycetota bacterium]
GEKPGDSGSGDDSAGAEAKSDDSGGQASDDSGGESDS